MKITGNKILITGGSSGIGFALAQQFIKLGNQVITADRNKEKQKATLEKLTNLITFTCDITKKEDIDQLLVFIENEHPDVNVVINNAGIQYNYDFTETNNPEHWIEKEIQTNVTAVMKLSGLLLPILMNQDEAAIVNVSSTLAFLPKMSAPVYCASKAAVHIFTKAMRYQLEKTRVKVFEIIPPLVETAMTEGRGSGKISPEELVEQFIKSFQGDHYEVNIGKARLLRNLHWWLPSFAENILKNKA